MKVVLTDLDLHRMEAHFVDAFFFKNEFHKMALEGEDAVSKAFAVSNFLPSSSEQLHPSLCTN